MMLGRCLRVCEGLRRAACARIAAMCRCAMIRPPTMPTFDDWLRSPDAQLPRPPTNADMAAYLRGLFDAHLNAIRAFDPGPVEDAVRAELPNITTLGNRLIASVEAFLAGCPGRAFSEFTVAVSAVSASLNALTSPITPTTLRPTYRMRVSTVPRRFTREELFHIPFEERRLVGSKRFSVEGLPCLYLGHSTYVCWEGMRRPSFSSVYVGQFRFRDGAHLHILDLGYVPRFQQELMTNYRALGPSSPRLAQILTALAVIWPLHAACAIRVLDAAKPFKPEYIIPQLLLQWVTERTDWHGILYFSTHVGTPTGWLVGMNLVLPARRMAPRGYCAQLRGMFDVTPVWNWEVALAAPPVPQIPSPVGGAIEAAPGAFVEYVTTQFYSMEMILGGQAATPI
jgi:hypothetical protein